MKLTLLLTISTLLINGLIFSLADIDYKEYHWLPLLPFGASLLIAEIGTERFSMKHIPRMLLMLIMLSVTMCSFITVKKEQETPLLPIHLGYNQITDRLLELGLTEGHTAFWCSAVLRETSNGTMDSIIYE